MRKINLPGLLVSLQKENPTKPISVIRLIWPDIKAALQRGHMLKEIHERLVKGGLKIGYKKLSVYVSRLRREDAKEQRQPDDEFERINLSFLRADGTDVVVWCPESRNAVATKHPSRRSLQSKEVPTEKIEKQPTLVWSPSLILRRPNRSLNWRNGISRSFMVIPAIALIRSLESTWPAPRK